jgi:hypothetical protein
MRQSENTNKKLIRKQDVIVNALYFSSTMVENSIKSPLTQIAILTLDQFKLSTIIEV